MTEKEWLDSADMDKLLHCLCEQFGVESAQGSRKMRLLACGLARTAWDLVPDGICKDVVVACEEFAEGWIDEKRMAQSWAEIEEEHENYFSTPWYVLTKLRQALRSRDWGKNGKYVSEAADEIRRVYIAWLKDAGASAAIRRDQDAEMKCKHINLIHDIYGNPFARIQLRPSRLMVNVVSLAQEIHAERAFDRLPILADALEANGCTNEDILGHLRDTHQEHCCGCWALDLVLGKQ